MADELIDAFGLEDALVLWAHFGFLDAPLRARLGFLAGPGPRPQAAFFACGGRAHPSAPLTGLAVLAAARRGLSWPELRGLDAVETGVGTIALRAPWSRVTGRPRSSSLRWSCDSTDDGG